MTLEGVMTMGDDMVATGEDMERTRKAAQEMTDALNATSTGSLDPGQVADAVAAGRAERRHDEQLALRTTALRAAAKVTAGMSEAEAQTDHDSRDHDPEHPVTDVIALAGEFEDWLSRPDGQA